MRKFIITSMVAVAAMFMLGAGGATAASLIGSAQIKDNSVQSRDIKNGTLTLDDMSNAAKAAMRGSQGIQGIQGVQGPTGKPGVNGIQGPAGGFDPAKVSYVAGPTVTVVSGDAGTSVAQCPAGTKVVGGGYFFGYTNGGITVEMSGPLADGTGWIAGFGNAGTVEGEATAYAVCAAR